jgi:hypothetical protein
MRQLRPRRERTYSPLRDKTLNSILCHQFVTEFGFENKIPIAEVMIERILDTIESFVRPHSLLKPGQLLWMAVRHDGRKHTFRSMKETPQVPVILDLVSDDDLQALASGKDFLAVRRGRHARLLDQALAQGGVLAQTDLSAITLASNRQVGDDVAHIQESEDRLLPYRGSVQDLGPTLSHKVDVARLLEAGYLEPEICRKLSPVHDLRSVERYAQTYKNVLKLLDRGFAPTEISGILSLSNRLVSSYLEIVKEHHPQVLATNPHLRESAQNAMPIHPKGHKS